MTALDAQVSVKVVLLGDSGVGKTAIIDKYVNPGFEGEQEVTTAPKCSRKTLMCGGMPVSMNIWDTPGDSKYRAMGELFYKEASIIFLVFDASRPSTLEVAEFWLTEVLSKSRATPLITLVCSKFDLGSPDSRASDIAQSHSIAYEQVSTTDPSTVKSLFLNAAKSFCRQSGVKNASMMLSQRIIQRKRCC